MHTKGQCPYDHAKAAIEEARRRYLTEWKTERSTLNNLNNEYLLTETFGRQDVNNFYDLFQANAEHYQSQLQQGNTNAGDSPENIDAT